MLRSSCYQSIPRFCLSSHSSMQIYSGFIWNWRDIAIQMDGWVLYYLNWHFFWLAPRWDHLRTLCLHFRKKPLLLLHNNRGRRLRIKTHRALTSLHHYSSLRGGSWFYFRQPSKSFTTFPSKLRQLTSALRWIRFKLRFTVLVLRRRDNRSWEIWVEFCFEFHVLFDLIS